MFPDNYLGNPNVTIMPDGRRFEPETGPRLGPGQGFANLQVPGPGHGGHAGHGGLGHSHRGASFVHEVPHYGAAHTQVLEQHLTFDTIE